MSELELGGVISTAPLEEEPNGPVEVASCPRELIGLTCLAGSYPCLCEQTASCELDTTSTDSGVITTVTLTLGLNPQVHDVAVVKGTLKLTGYKAELVLGRDKVIANYNLRRPQNVGLRNFVQDVGV